MEHQEQLGKIQAAGAVGKNSSSTIVGRTYTYSFAILV